MTKMARKKISTLAVGQGAPLSILQTSDALKRVARGEGETSITLVHGGSL